MFECVTTRLVTQQECPWLPKDVPTGTSVIPQVDLYGVCTRTNVCGVYTRTGTLVELVGWEHGHVEIPNDALPYDKEW